MSAHPSRSYSLNELGRRLPEFVRRARVPRPTFCGDLARLEWAVAEVFDAPETQALGEPELSALASSDWERARLVPVAALRLVALDWDAHEWLASFREGERGRAPSRRVRTFVAVYRRDYAVKRREQSQAAFALLSDLAAGVSIGRAVARALGRRGRARLEGPDAAFRLFRDWSSMGLFRAVAHEPRTTVARRRGARRARA